MSARFAIPVGLITLAAGCSSSAAEQPLVERIDSAGVTIVNTLGGDRPLEWSFAERLRLGGAEEGPESFYQLSPHVVDSDARGNLYVLDAAAHRVVVFSPDGRHLRTLGGKGGGPGELESPLYFAVSEDGAVAVRDISKPALVRWDAEGKLQPSDPLGIPLYSPFALAGGTLIAILAGEGEKQGEARDRLLVMGSSDTTVVAAATRPSVGPIDFGCVAMNLPPRYTPELIWDVAGSRVAATAEIAYDIHLRDDDRLLRIRRPVEPRTVSREMALADAGEGMTVGFAGARSPCKISAELLIERQGHAEKLPVVGRITLAPDGEIWVQRRGMRGEPEIIDVFGADGVYLGTLPPGSPFPTGFTPDGGILAIETDDMDLDYLVVYQVEREG